MSDRPARVLSGLRNFAVPARLRREPGSVLDLCVSARAGSVTFEHKVLLLTLEVERLQTRILVLEATLRTIKRLSPEQYESAARPMIDLVLSKEGAWAA